MIRILLVRTPCVLMYVYMFWGNLQSYFYQESPGKYSQFSTTSVTDCHRRLTTSAPESGIRNVPGVRATA